MVGKSASVCKAYLPRHAQHHPTMSADALASLSASLRALMESSPDLRSQAAVGKRAGMDQRTVGRILNREHEPTIGQLDRLAKAFGLAPWQLLVPGLDPKNPPVIHLTETERAFYERMRQAVQDMAALKR